MLVVLLWDVGLRASLVATDDDAWGVGRMTRSAYARQEICDMDEHEELRRENQRLKEELAALEANYSFLVAAMDGLPNPIFMKDEGAHFFFFNERYAESFGMTREKYLGKSVLDLDYLPKADRVRYQEEDTELIRSEGLLSYEVDFTFADGKTHPSFYWSKGIHDKETGRRGLIGEIVDISQERRLRKALDTLVKDLQDANLKLIKMVELDVGTGLYNRTLLNKKSEEMGHGNVSSVMTCGLMADLDHFKRVNDRFGHIEGDRVLAHFAAILKSECRNGDLPIRYGGEEFLLFLSDASLDVGRAVAERIRKRCESEISLPDGEPVTVSIGVSIIDDGMDLQSNIVRLDRNLYLAKRQGRNRVVCS